MTILYSERRRVLLIDENSRRLSILATVLRSHEVEVHPASRLDEAKSLWKNIPYDLVLLAAPENSDHASLASAEIRKSKPRQRIALLVGPPAYIREIARPTAKMKPVRAIVPDVSSVESPSRPQWPAIVQRVVNDWYVDQSPRFVLDKFAGLAVGSTPFSSD